ncbi:MAG: type II toxin-antitoxin system VapC family toxin [Elusimicrobia bacterium]|nr:type II toxin-antitoxin system VapC family toxin [Elusimicrobiota bacterium]
MRIFLDSSALAKRYVEEPGSEEILRLCREAEEIILSSLCVPEIISGFARLKREGRLSASQYRKLKRELAADVDAATVVDLTPAVIGRAVGCLERSPLRALDAIHVACALESSCGLFVTADRRQRDAAVSFHLRLGPSLGLSS